MIKLYKLKRVYCLISIGVFIVVFNNELIAQDKEDLKKYANESIVRLKSGALLIQLQSKQNSIDAYIEKGYESIATEIRQEQKEGNIRIMKAFKESFHFCEVYFFLSDQIDAVRETQWEKVLFINEHYEKDPSIILEKSFYMIATYSKTGESKKDEQYKSILGFSAIIIKDMDFVEMTKPFPYYLKMPEEIQKLKKLKKKIYNYDKELRNFYYRQPVSNQ